MSPLLVCVPADRERAGELAAALGSAGSASVFVVEGGARLDWPELGRLRQHPVFVWTRNSVLVSNREFIAAAVGAQKRGRYLGLLAGAEQTPAAVTGASDLRLADWYGPSGPDTLLALGQELARRATVRRGLGNEIYHLLANLNWWAKALGLGVAISALLAVLQAFPNADDALCSPRFMAGPCSVLGLGDLPTEAEEAGWQAVRASTDCQTLQQFIDRFGPDGRYQELVQRSLSQARPVQTDTPAGPSGPMALLLPLEPVEAQPGPAREKELDSAFQAYATRQCAAQANALGAEVRSLSVQRSADARCQTGIGTETWCEVEGTMVCLTVRQEPVMMCPQPQSFRHTSVP